MKRRVIKTLTDFSHLMKPSVNISHLRCGPVGVRFIESRFAGRHKCRPYKDLKWDFLYYPVRERWFGIPKGGNRQMLDLLVANSNKTLAELVMA